MIKSKITLSQVKKYVQNLSQKRVSVTINLGRNKFLSYNGTLTGVYSALFTVLPDDKDFTGKTTYSYAEFLCGKVKLKKEQA